MQVYGSSAQHAKVASEIKVVKQDFVRQANASRKVYRYRVLLVIGPPQVTSIRHRARVTQTSQRNVGRDY